jgi:uncharacterized cupredoxin-like copper-binding protein
LDKTYHTARYKQEEYDEHECFQEVTKMIYSKILQLAAFSVFVLLLLSACGGSPAVAPQPTQITVDMVEFMFNPETVRVPAGGQVELTLVNSGALEHEWVIMNLGTRVSEPFDDNDEANIYWEKEVEPRSQAVETFTAPSEPGEYQIVCGIAGHLEAGMVGTLIVEN